jgi:hypothetical protein
MGPNERVTVLGADIVGDPLAPEGSRPWAVAMRLEIQQLLNQQRMDHEALQRCFDAFNRNDGWRQLADAKGKPFPSYSAFCKARKPYGLGRDAGEIDALLREGAAKRAPEERAAEAKPLAGHGNQEGENNSRNRDSDATSVGRGADYLTARIARDRPDVLERMKAGEFPSVRAAAIAAGIVKVPTPLDVLKRAWAKAGKRERDDFMGWVSEEGW